jgi:DNA-binding response OmpR family regulator
MSADPFDVFVPTGFGGRSQSAYRNLRFLVVEDHEVSRQTLRLCIQTMGGFSVDIAQSHGDALHRIRSRMPDVIVCDYLLGDGRTGQQLLEELRRSSRLPERVVFIMVTAERNYEKVVSAVELIPDDYIIKPFAPELLRLRLEKVIQKKKVFHDYYKERESLKYDAAVNALERMLEKPCNAIYRYEILRSRAVTLAQAGKVEAAMVAYEAILAEYPFPWAKAGLARMCNLMQRYDEARAIVEEVIEQVPAYFEAYDLMADICGHQGDFGEAQAILAEASRRTPRNYVRKKSLSVAAGRRGDFETARAVMADVVANDAFGDHRAAYLDLARSAMDAGREDVARELLASVAPDRSSPLDDEAHLCIECLSAVIEGEAGAARFDRVRAEIAHRRRFSVKVAVELTRAALYFSDRQLADMIAEKTLAGPDAREVFIELLAIYRQRGLEQPFRELQKVIATRRATRPRAKR